MRYLQIRQIDVDEISVDKMSVDEMSVGEMPLDKMTVYAVYRQTDRIWHVSVDERARYLKMK